MGEGAGGSDDDAGHHGQERREGDGGDKREQQVSAQGLGELGSGQVPRRVRRRDLFLSHVDRGSVAQDGEQHEEEPHEYACDGDGATRRVGVGHGQKAHQHVRQADRPEGYGDGYWRARPGWRSGHRSRSG